MRVCVRICVRVCVRVCVYVYVREGKPERGKESRLLHSINFKKDDIAMMKNGYLGPLAV